MRSRGSAACEVSNDGDSLLLLIGVMSYRAPVALGRRQSMRHLSRKAPRTALRFVLSSDTPDDDAAYSDMLTFHVNESSRTLGTYLLNNAFFRHAVALRPRVPFIARADDDSYFDVPTVLAELVAAAASAAKPRFFRQGRRRRRTTLHAQGSAPAVAAGAAAASCAFDHAFERNVVYGDFHEWYSWSPTSMQATCFGFGHSRHSDAVRRLDELRGDVRQLPRFQFECLYEDLVGPYP